MQIPECMTAKELCAHLRISRRTLSRMQREGLPHIRINPKIVRFPVEAVNRWLQQKGRFPHE